MSKGDLKVKMLFKGKKVKRRFKSKKVEKVKR